MELLDKLTILADAAKYDAACTSSGLDRAGRPGGLGSTLAAGCCHSFSADGRCISLLKVLLTNRCVYDCAYCVNRRSSDVRRAAFTPRELAELTIGFYRRNYIEGLFLSSAVWGGPDRTTEAMIEALRLLREEYGFRGYIHAKAIPGADPLLTRRLGLLADRLSVNIELPSEESLGRLAPDKAKAAILAPMAQIRDGIQASRGELARFRRERLGFIFQDCNLLDTLTAGENIALALSIVKAPAQEIDGRVKEMAGLLGISDCLNKYPYQMSGGQQQRCAAARAMVTRPALVLADEPTGALDSKSAKLLLDRLEHLNREMGATILMVTHDAFTASCCRRVVFLRDGKVFAQLERGGGDRRTFFQQIIRVVTQLGGEMEDVL